MCANVWKPGVHVRCLLLQLFSTSRFEAGSLTKPGAHQLGEAARSGPSALGLYIVLWLAFTRMLGIHISGHHTCVVGIFLTKPSPQPHDNNILLVS